MSRPRQTHFGLPRLVPATVTIVIVLGICVPRVLAQCEVAQLFASDAAPGDRFGWKVAIDGDWAITGAPWDDDGCVGDPDCNTGSAYTYQRVDQTWVQRTKLTAPDAAPGDAFGDPVSISGDLVVVSARYADSGQSDVGAAYVFRRSGEEWVFEAKLTASDGLEGDFYGTSVYVAGDVIVVGASSVDCEAGGVCGAVYVFRHNGATWVEDAKLTASDASTTNFGTSVATDGERIVVGALSDRQADQNTGSAYVFRRDGAQWIEQAKLLASDARLWDRFGLKVGIDGDSIIVSSMFFDPAVCTANGACDSGSAYLFRFDGLVWLEEGKLVASDADPFDAFGRSVALDGDTALVGSKDGTYLFRRLGGAWEEIVSIAPSDYVQYTGWSVSLSDPYAIVSAPFDDDFGGLSGSAYVFRVVGAPDVNANGINDACEADCNENGVLDQFELEAGTSDDCNENGVPDECEPDCNGNGVADSCDIDAGASPDCSADGIPDECDTDCNGNMVPDTCDLIDGTGPDCNANGILDACDILGGASPDTDESGIPDECEPWLRCQTGVDFFDYTPHRDDVMAEYLAMQLSGTLRAPDYEYDRVHRDLELIRSVFPAVNIVQYYGEHAPDQMVVRLDVDLSQDGFDQLNAYYQVIEDRQFSIDPAWHELTFCDTLNIPGVVPAYEVLPEVLSAGPNRFIGGGDYIRVTPIGTTYRYEFAHGSGDCSSGCTCVETWTVDVVEDGCITDVLSPSAVGFCSSCCLGSQCFGAAPDTCASVGGTLVGQCLGDSDGDGSDDACAAWPGPVPPAPDAIPDTGGIMVNSTKGRYLSFYSTDFGRNQALRVTLMDLPPPHDIWNARSLWVGEPAAMSPGPCGMYSVPPPLMAATLHCGGPTFRDWADVGVVHVYHEAIIPDGTYRVEVVDAEFPSIFSDPLEMTTATWGDTVETCSTAGCTPPEGSVDIGDALAILARFASAPGSIILPRADLEPACVDFKINVSDVMMSLRGFTGQSYPFAPSAADPCDAACAIP